MNGARSPAVMVLVSLVAFAACGSDDDDAKPNPTIPTITLSNGPTPAYEAGATGEPPYFVPYDSGYEDGYEDGYAGNEEQDNFDAEPEGY